MSQALKAAYSEASTLIGNLARRRGVPSQDVQDVIHTAILQALDRAHSFDCGRPLMPWLTGIAELSIQEWRAGRLRLRQPRACGVDPDEVPESCSRGRDPVEEAARREQSRWLNASLAALPLSYRRSLTEHYLHGMRTREMAERAGRSRKAVERELDRALAGLRRLARRRPAGPFPDAERVEA